VSTMKLSSSTSCLCKGSCHRSGAEPCLCARKTPWCHGIPLRCSNTHHQPTEQESNQKDNEMSFLNNFLFCFWVILFLFLFFQLVLSSLSSSSLFSLSFSNWKRSASSCEMSRSYQSCPVHLHPPCGGVIVVVVSFPFFIYFLVPSVTGQEGSRFPSSSPYCLTGSLSDSGSDWLGPGLANQS